jgi:hypothetical protein
MTGFPHDPNLARSHRQQQPLVDCSTKSNRDKEELVTVEFFPHYKILPPSQQLTKKTKPTAEFFPHCDNRPRKQNPSKKKKNKGPGSAWKLPGHTDTHTHM